MSIVHRVKGIDLKQTIDENETLITSCPGKLQLYPQKFAQTSPTSGGRPVGIVRSRTEATKFSLVCFLPIFSTTGKEAKPISVFRELEQHFGRQTSSFCEVLLQNIELTFL
jgi:hypothetical protein